MRLFASAVCVVGLMSGACSIDPTSSEEYEALERELGAARQQIDELTAERDQLAETAASRSSSGEVEEPDEIASLRERLDMVEAVAPLLGYFAGVDPEIVDAQQYESWAGVVELGMAVEAVGDPQLTKLYTEHLSEGGFSPGPEELVLRLIELTIEPILGDR